MTIDPAAQAAAIARDVDTYLRTQEYRNGPPPQEVVDKFLAVCQRSGLSPLAGHIHLIARKTRWVIHTGIDGFRYGSGLEPSYAGCKLWWKKDEESPWQDYPPTDRALVAKAVIKKLLSNGQVEETEGIAHADWYDTGAPGPWQSMQPQMLGKCGEALARRSAFPARFGGIYTLDEMDQSGTLKVEHRILAAATEDELDALVPELQALSPQARDKARPLWLKRQAQLREQGIATSPGQE